jgi:RNA-directed DNA polymerase
VKDRTTRGFSKGSIGAIDWTDIDWKAVNRKVLKLRYRIFRAANNARSGIGSWNTVRSLMKLLHRSFTALLHAIRKVTYLNQGKNTPGIDGITITDRNRIIRKWNWDMVKYLPTRRVYIPKSNGKKRPLGIAAIHDRIAQAILLLSYEAVFEGTFEGSSYGFRPGRSCQDAIADVFIGTAKNSINKWVLEADIKGAFDNISHQFILDRIHGLPGSEMITKWLKSGYIEKGGYFDTTAGTPQGGIISPLLANIALDGLEELLNQFTWEHNFPSYKAKLGRYKNQKRIKPKYKYVRYADDFVILCPTREGLEEILPLIEEWLSQRGLTLNKEKTKITKITDGFEFLGFNIRQFEGNTLRHDSLEYNRQRNKPDKNGKFKTPQANPKGAVYLKAIIRPSKKKIKDFLAEIWELIKVKSLYLPWGEFLKQLNSKLRGWGNYYRRVVSKSIFNYINHKVVKMLMKILGRKHPKKGWKWIRKTYFTHKDGNNWTAFGTTKGRKGEYTIYLTNIAKDIPIVRHVKVKESNSTLDPELKDYWEKRNEKNAKERFAKNSKYQEVMNRQKGICPICGETITEHDSWDLHHIIPVKDGGTDKAKNLVFLHKECHKAKHKNLHW